MSAFMTRRHAMIAVAVFGAAGALGAACSRWLDESKIKEGDASVVTDAAGDGGVPDAAYPVGCTADPDCKPANSCLTGRCDLTRKICLYDLCPAAACKASVCDTNSKTCSVPTTYGFRAGSFKVTAGNAGGCGG